ncbi:hypothetical protein QZH41_014619, partial [Actinostola sp. cb2023]
MDTNQAYEVERVQALRLIRKVVAMCPKACPMSLAASLVSTGSDDRDEQDRLKRACLATLCELGRPKEAEFLLLFVAIKNAILSSYAGGIRAITRNVLDCQMARLNESLMVTLLYLLNYKTTRQFVRLDVGLEGVLAPFTDLHYRHSADTPESQMKEDRDARLQASKMALITIFRSWSGIINFCKPDGKGLQSLLGVFCLQDSEVRRGIMDVLSEIFKIKEPTWTDDFDVALLSVDPSQMKDSWKLSEDFVAQEGRELLPRATRTTGRTNLIINYSALLLAAFVNAGLLEACQSSLVEVITSSDCFISVRATILLGELLHLANTILPPECSSHSHCLPTLVNTATSFEVSSTERGRASAAVNCLDRLHQMKKRGPLPCSLYLDQIIMQQELEEPYLASIRDSQVMMEKDFRNWDWDLIEATLQSPFISLKKIEEINNQRFIRNLLNFYKPSGQKFSAVKLTDSRSKIFSRVGLLLIDFLLDPEDATNIGSNVLQELVQEIAVCLQEVLSTKMASSGVLSNNNVHNNLSRDYFLFIGKLSSTKAGSKLLDKTGIYQYLFDLCSSTHESLLKLIIASLDYRENGIPRIILSKILTSSTDPSCRLYATMHMRVLLRSKIAFFNNWGMEFLVNQLYDTNPRVATEAADVLDEACEDEANLQYLVQLRPVLLHLGDKGIRLMTRYSHSYACFWFVSVERGFSYLASLGYLEVLLHQWQEHYKLDYVRWIDNMLAESLTTYTKPTDDESYVRRSNKRQVISDAYLPPHLYGELVQKKHGFKLLQKTKEVENCVCTIRTLEPDSRENVQEIKAALWALGHCGSSNWGITLLMEEDIIPDIVGMAEESENFAMRGTCYYVLGLIAKTRQGTEILNDLQWISIRHIGTEEWPVVESQDQIIPALMFASPVASSPTYTAFNLGKISESNDNGIYHGDEPKKATDSSYDELSGIYIGEDTSSKKPTHEERPEGGILARWYEEAERRQKIAKRETGLYDDASGVYLGNEKAPQKSLLNQEEFVPGGIMAKLYQDSGLSKGKDSKHRRNLSEGNFSSSTSALNDVKDIESKRRTYSNVEHLQASVDYKPRGSPVSRQDSGLEMVQRQSLTSSNESSPRDEPLNMKSREHSQSSDARSRYDSTGSELMVPVSHVRTDSNVSSISEGSVGYRDRESSFDSSIDLDEPHSYRISPVDNRISPSAINPPPRRLQVRSTEQYPEDSDKLKPDQNRHPMLLRQRSISMTEKKRTKSPTLALIAENRSSSFHGSTEFSKITTSKRASGELPASPRSSNTDDDIDLLSNYTSTNSLAEVKILSDKTIVFRSGIEKDRSLSFDSAQVSELRRDRLLVGSQLSEPEVESGSFKPRSRASSFEKAELARRLGLKSGDISQRPFNRSRSTSSGYASDYNQRKRIINKNSLLGNTDYVTISGDSNKHARSSSDLGTYTTMRDASGYVALSTLRRQHSLSRETLANADSYNRPIFTAGPASTENANTRESLSSSTNSYEYRQLTSSLSSSTGTEFVGLCLPLNLSMFFQVEPYVFQGSWPDNFISDPVTVGIVNTTDELDDVSDEHDPSRCVGCMYSKRTKSMNERRKSADSFIDPEKISYRSETTEDSQSSVSPSSMSSMSDSIRDGPYDGRNSLDGSSPGGRIQIRQEILRLVVKLSSAVGTKSHQEGLL